MGAGWRVGRKAATSTQWSSKRDTVLHDARRWCWFLASSRPACGATAARDQLAPRDAASRAHDQSALYDFAPAPHTRMHWSKLPIAWAPAETLSWGKPFTASAALPPSAAASAIPARNAHLAASSLPSQPSPSPSTTHAPTLGRRRCLQGMRRGCRLAGAQPAPTRGANCSAATRRSATLKFRCPPSGVLRSLAHSRSDSVA